jgi:hypothetical protein
VWLGGQRGLAKVVCHNVKSRQEGVHIDHSICSLSCRRESNATGRGPFRSAISCQFTPSV